MQAKMYKLRSMAADNGSTAFIDLNLEFEGKRAFIIWDTITLGQYELKARLEIDPKLLQKVNRNNCDFIYYGKLVLPRPQDN